MLPLVPRRRLALLAVAVALAGCTDRTPSGELSPLVGPASLVEQTGASITVNSLADPGDGTCTDDAGGCTLREAITAVSAGGTISFAVSGAVALGSQLAVAKPLTITGPGAAQLTVSGSHPYRVIELVDAGTVNISGITLAAGATDGPGGCVNSVRTQLTLTLAVVRNCTSQGASGGINSDGGTLTLDRVTVRGNWAANGGGGIYVNHNSTASISASTISGNEGREGGGIGTTGYVTITNSTVSGNVGRANGGGVYAADRGLGDGGRFGMTIVSSTIAGNTAGGDGGGIFNSQGTFSVTGTIIADNTDVGSQAPDCGAASPQLVAGGHNLIENVSGCAAFLATAVVTGQDPMLASLGDNGGPTFTHALAAGSPAIDAGGMVCPATDQRGFARPVGAGCDIGAFERQAVIVSIDVRPGSADNPVNLRAPGIIPVAILSSSTFDARTVDVSSVLLQGAGVATRNNGAYQYSYQDVNGDGLVDLLLLFDGGALGIVSSTTSFTLVAVAGGVPITGTNMVRVVP